MENCKNIILCGVGGQGTVLCAKLIAAAAMNRGFDVMSAETIGMAQRGGSVFSHIRYANPGKGGLYSPMISRHSADLMLAFEPGEAVRMLPFLKKDGLAVVSMRPVMPVSASLSGQSYSGEAMLDYLKKSVKRLLLLDTEKALRALGSSRVLNLLLLGAALSAGAFSNKEPGKDAIKKEVDEAAAKETLKKATKEIQKTSEEAPEEKTEGMSGEADEAAIEMELGIEDLREALRRLLPEKLHELNFRALSYYEKA